MPRPRKTDGERRSEALGLRLTPAERLRVERAALQAGLSTSEYVRAQVLNGRVIVHQSWTLGHVVFDELRRIGVNLNQLTRLAHQRQQFPAGLTDVCRALEDLLARELDAALEGRTPVPDGRSNGPDPAGPGDGPGPAAKRGSACGHPSSGAPATDDGS